jgi:putative ABC transport system substrate-binding protein
VGKSNQVALPLLLSKAYSGSSNTTVRTATIRREMDMKRRDFLCGLGAAAGVWLLTAQAQSPGAPVVGFLHSGSSGPSATVLAEFRRGLGEAGFVEGDGVRIVYRWAEDRFDRLPALAADLVQRNVSLIAVGGGDVTALAAKTATTTIPIVFAIGADPVQQQIVASLNRPGGNITGATFLAVEVRPKMVELIRDLMPQIKRIAVLANPNRPGFEQLMNDVTRPAEAAGLTVRALQAGNERELDAAFASLTQVQVDGLLVLSDPVYTNRREQIVRLIDSYRIPAISGSREIVKAGGLMSYGASIEDAYRQAGAYAGRILKGEKPANLPVMQPTKFELVINLKTAKALGLAVPPTLLARADEVIE